jgi:hypothetical protein
MGLFRFKHRAIFSLLVVLAGFVFAAPGCGGRVAPLQLSLLIPEDPDPLVGVETIRIRVTGTDMDAMLTESARDALQIEVSQIPTGDDRVITIEGLDGEGRILSWGQTAPFTLSIASPSSLAVYFARNGQFSLAKARLLKGRYDHTLTALPDGRVVVAGGRTKNGPTSSVEIFQPNTRTFVEAASLNKPRSGHRAILVDDKIVFVAGEDGEPLKSVEIYDPTSGPVIELQLEEARAGHTVAALPGNKVMVMGGENEGKELASVEIIDVALRTISQGPALNSKRSRHIALGFDDGLVIVAGGQVSESGLALVTDAEIYKTETDGSAKWNSVSSLPDPRTNAVAVNLPDGRGLIVGGEDETGSTLRAAVIFDPKTEKFLPSDTTNAGYTNHAAAALGDGALVVGGKETREVALLQGNFFVDGGQLLMNREDFELAPLLDGTILAAGGRNGSEIRDDAEFYTPQR